MKSHDSANWNPTPNRCFPKTEALSCSIIEGSKPFITFAKTQYTTSSIHNCKLRTSKAPLEILIWSDPYSTSDEPSPMRRYLIITTNYYRFLLRSEELFYKKRGTFAE